MNHQPFEDWLLSKETLTPQQEAELSQHLQNCPACASLACAWQGVEHEIRQAGQAAPMPGFSERWQVRLVEKHAQKQRRLAWWAIGLNLSIVLGIFMGLNWNWLSNLSFSNLLVSGLYTFTLLAARMDSVEALVKILFEDVNPLVPLAVISITGSIISLLCLVWFASMLKIFIPQGARNNEARH